MGPEICLRQYTDTDHSCSREIYINEASERCYRIAQRPGFKAFDITLPAFARHLSAQALEHEACNPSLKKDWMEGDDSYALIGTTRRQHLQTLFWCLKVFPSEASARRPCQSLRLTQG